MCPTPVSARRICRTLAPLFLACGVVVAGMGWVLARQALASGVDPGGAATVALCLLVGLTWLGVGTALLVLGQMASAARLAPTRARCYAMHCGVPAAR